MGFRVGPGSSPLLPNRTTGHSMGFRVGPSSSPLPPNRTTACWMGLAIFLGEPAQWITCLEASERNGSCGGSKKISILVLTPLVWWDVNLSWVEKRDECIGEGCGGGVQDTRQKTGKHRGRESMMQLQTNFCRSQAHKLLNHPNGYIDFLIYCKRPCLAHQFGPPHKLLNHPNGIDFLIYCKDHV